MLDQLDWRPPLAPKFRPIVALRIYTGILFGRAGSGELGINAFAISMAGNLQEQLQNSSRF